MTDTSGEIDAKRHFVYVAKGFVNPREQLSTPKLVPGAARAGCPELPRHFTWQKARAQVQHFVLQNAEDTVRKPDQVVRLLGKECWERLA